MECLADNCLPVESAKALKPDIYEVRKARITDNIRFGAK